MQLHKHVVVLCQHQVSQESDSYQGLLTFSHLWRKIQGSSPQHEAGGEQREREGGKTNRLLREKETEGVKARKERVGGRGRYSAL